MTHYRQACPSRLTVNAERSFPTESESSIALLKARILVGCSDGIRWRHEEV
jgi:hypothetical protein